MNKSFKVVFSKARSALMVVNEATSSIQAKGTKTVIATAAAAMLAGGAAATTTDATLVITNAANINPQTTTVGQKYLKDGQVFQDLTIAAPTNTTGYYGALYVYVNGVSGANNSAVTVSGLKFLNNTTYTKAAEGKNNALYGQGGAAAVYHSNIKFVDAQFTGNTAQGHGGALLIANGIQSEDKCSVEVAVTANKKAVYAGNKAGSGYTKYEDMGGFAYLRDASTLTLNVDKGSFLTIGEAGAAQTAGLDSIASVGDGEQLKVTGGGSVTINGSTENFAGTITVASGSSLTMATGFGSRVTRQQIEANKTSGSDSATEAAEKNLKLASVLEVASGASATINDVLEITGQTAAATSQEGKTPDYQQAGTVVKVQTGGAFVVDGIKVTSHTYADKLAATANEKLGVGVKTVGKGLIEVAASGSAIVKNDVTVDGNSTMIKAGEGELKVNGAVVTAAAVKSGSSGETPAGIFDIQAGHVTAAKITNAGTTNVASGAALTLTGTGSVNSGTISIVGTTTSQGTGTKAGSLTVAKGADFVNTGFISGSANTKDNKTTYTADNKGDVFVAGTFTNYGTVDGKTVNGYIGANSLTVEEGGVLNTKITDSYAVAKTTVKGTFNLTELNSSVSGKETDPKDQLVLVGVMTLDGGLVTLNGQEFTGNVQLGLSNGKPDDTNATVAAATVAVKGARDYKASQITFRPKGQSKGNDSTLTLEEGYEGTYTVGTLDAVGAGSVTVNGGTLNVDTKLTTKAEGTGANVHVGKDGTLALTKTAIGLTVATSGDSAAVADTFKGVQNEGRVLVTGLDGMTVKADTLAAIKNAIVKTNTGFRC